MKNRKKSLIIWFIIIILIFVIWFFINQKSESNNYWHTNWKDKNKELEDDYKIIESNNQSCSIDNDCETPFEYLIRSDCPYESKCIQNTCTIICPDFEWNWEKLKMQFIIAK